MPYIKVTDNVTGEVKEWELELEKDSENESERKPRKAGKKAQEPEQTES